MRWQYRTILFEFQKDGLLGDRYLDDEEIDKTLNRQGRNGWELVNVALLQEGLLAFLKRPVQAEATSVAGVARQDPAQPQPVESVRRPAGDTAGAEEVTAEKLQQREREHIRQLEEKRRQAMQEREKDLVGDIRIS